MRTVKKASCLCVRRLLSHAITTTVGRASEGHTKVMKAIMLALALAAVVLLGGTSTVRADTNCTGTLTGMINGNVTVPKDGSCTIEIATVTGNVKVSQGASLIIQAYTEPSSIGGNVEASHCKSALLEGNVTVGGNLQIHQCTGKSDSGFQGPGIKIGGNFNCHDNSGPCRAWLGDVAGNVQIHDNGSTTASDISLVTIGGDLECRQNTPAPTHNYGPDWVKGNLQGQCAASRGFAAKGTSIVSPGRAPGAGTACENLASLTDFPVPNTVVTSATVVAATATLPEHCRVNGIINQRVSPVDSCPYGDGFEARLPLPADWNGRFMFQGNGGSGGTLPAGTGNAGTLTPTLAHGYAVMTDDSGHQNSQLALCGTKNNYQFTLDPMATIDNSYQSIQVATLTAKRLIDAYYGKGPNYSYWYGCSAGGRQGMVMSQRFPQYYDGIVAGDPVYDIQAVNLTEIWGIQQIREVYLSTTPPLPPIQFVPGPVPEAAEPILFPAFPRSDQALFEAALLQTCDALDGVADGVIDNLPACQALFDPATATYVSGGTSHPLQCTGAKDATCLSSAQIQAVKHINQGPRTTTGQTIRAPSGAVAKDHVDNTVLGYAYDGGFMTTAGIPSRKIGTAATPPGDFGAGVRQVPYLWISPPNPSYDTLSFNFDFDTDILTASSPETTNSTSLNIKRFIRNNGKIIWYHGLSDPGPPVTGTINYYLAMANQNGGLQAAQDFSRFYPIPNMGHCSGGPSTDQFDMLTPLTDWVEKGIAPTSILASGVNFTSDVYGVPVSAPTSRSRPLCPYPQQVRYIGGSAGLPGSLSDASNYECIIP
jgi:hypothetical protein